MTDPFLNYLALALLFFVVIVIFYAIIAIHDVPHRIAEARGHPHQDAIHAAGWVSLFTLHALWPFLWIWAMLYRPERGWGVRHEPSSPSASSAEAERDLAVLRERLAELERKFDAARQTVLESPRRSVTGPTGSMPLEEDVVLPAAHAEEDLSQQGKVVQVAGVDRDLPRRAKG
jgi:hypothetical protein